MNVRGTGYTEGELVGGDRSSLCRHLQGKNFLKKQSQGYLHFIL